MEPLPEARRFDVALTQGQGVQIGEHVHQTNIFQLLAAAGPTLSTHIRRTEFQTLIQEHTKNFIGRDFVFKAIDDALHDDSFPSGYIVIRGEPGIGKTALIGELVKRWSCVHHFNISSQNIRSAGDFLSNVCAQLIIRYDLPHSVLPPHAGSDSGFLSQLLLEASTKNAPQPVLILIDAIDEADSSMLAPRVNCLYLPSTLPAGVFIIVTSREVHDQRLLVDREKPIGLRENDLENQRDVEVYITNFVLANHELMRRRIGEWCVTDEEFVEILRRNSEGNFMYLVYVLSDIRSGALTKTSISDIRNLPKGLKSYYQRHWRMMSALEPERFEKYYEPVVCQLAVAREAVSMRQLEEWTHLPSIKIIEVIQTWRQFLNEDAQDATEPLFRLYHASFQEFLREEVGLERFHERIVDTALKKLPGFQTAI